MMEILIEQVLDSAKSLAVNGIWIVVVVMILVAFLGQFKRKDGTDWLTGNAKLITGFVIGFVLAVLAYIANNRPEQSADWYVWFTYSFLGFLYGVIVGVVPSGTYELLLKKKDNATSSAVLGAIESTDYKE